MCYECARYVYEKSTYTVQINICINENIYIYTHIQWRRKIWEPPQGERFWKCCFMYLTPQCQDKLVYVCICILLFVCVHVCICILLCVCVQFELGMWNIVVVSESVLLYEGPIRTYSDVGNSLSNNRSVNVCVCVCVCFC